MQILPRLLIGDVSFDKIRRTFDTYLQRLVEAINHNAKEIEINFATQVVPAATVPFAIPHVGRKIVAINASLASGACNISIRHNGDFIVWKTASSTLLALTTAVTSDTAKSFNSVPADSKLQVLIGGLASPVGLVITLRTGS